MTYDHCFREYKKLYFSSVIVQQITLATKAISNITDEKIDM